MQGFDGGVGRMNTKVVGSQGEKLAVEYLTKHGCRLVAQNFRMRSGEIDVIVMDRGCLCFVEVKTRKGQHTPQEAVSLAKQRKLTRLAKIFMVQRFQKLDMNSRFDVIAVDSHHDGSPRLQWFRNAFDAVE